MSTALTLTPPSELAPTSQALAEYTSAEARAFVLATDEDLELAAGVINDIAARLAALEAIRQSVSLPISRALDTYNGFFRPTKEFAAEARKLWDDKIRAFLNAREATIRAAEVALQQAIVAQDAPAATAAIQAFQPAPRAAGLTLQDGWDFEERNHNIVPSSLTVTDRRLVMAEVKRQLAEGVIEPAIPGLKVFKRQVIKATG